MNETLSASGLSRGDVSRLVLDAPSLCPVDVARTRTSSRTEGYQPGFHHKVHRVNLQEDRDRTPGRV